jgi:hypothetical protein
MSVLFSVFIGFFFLDYHISVSDGNNILLLESLKESEQFEKAKHD